MAGKKHQFILGLVIKQMREYECQIMYVEGKFAGCLSQNIKIPPKLLRHRPDVIGITKSKKICIGEAKTDTDIENKRTKHQIIDFTSIQLNGTHCEVFIGLPMNSKKKFQKLLKDIGLISYPHLHLLYVPEELINK